MEMSDEAYYTAKFTDYLIVQRTHQIVKIDYHFFQFASTKIVKQKSII